jgi:hypothetical protein
MILGSLMYDLGRMAECSAVDEIFYRMAVNIFAYLNIQSRIPSRNTAISGSVN